MPKVTINGNEYEAQAGMSIIQVCDANGIEIPRFCYHERLSVAGNCRMCLVEVSPGPPKPQASCALPVADGMVIKTDSPMVKKAREGVMEFLLINHPLDCPICDQGGECDLQDQSMTYGKGFSRFVEEKRAVKDKYMGPLIKTHMTRCIQCTRCIRFASEIAGVEELGATGRSEDMEIGTYVEKALTSELSGNLVDVCPVGALTSKPYAFHARSWELKKTESIDVLDAVGSNIRIDVRGKAVMRILPRLNDDINEEWISDKTRYACDGLKNQRLDVPMVKVGGVLKETTWDNAFKVIAEKLANTPSNRVAAIVGDLAAVEEITALKTFMQNIKTPHMDCRQDGANIPAQSRADYIFNTTIAGLEAADFCLIVGANPRVEASLINARLRKRYLRGGFTVANVGGTLNLTFPVKELGNNPALLAEILAGNHEISAAMVAAKNPVIILGMAALTRSDGEEIHRICKQIAHKYNMLRDDWNGFNVLHTAAGRVGALDVGFLPAEGGMNFPKIMTASNGGGIDVLYLLGADELDTTTLGKAFVIYQGHHGDSGAHRADVILPAAAYTEKEATYVNTEGRVQMTAAALAAPGLAKEDWKIIRALSEACGKKIPFDNVEDIRAEMARINPVFEMKDVVLPSRIIEASGAAVGIENKPFKPVITNFYMTDAITRASRTMAECTSVIVDGSMAKEAA